MVDIFVVDKFVGCWLIGLLVGESVGWQEGDCSADDREC
jgi:hypothetical protein